MSKVIGIDLGTTNCVAAVFHGRQPHIIVNSNGIRTTPSIVAFTEGGDVLIGDQARNQQVMNPVNTIYSIKRFMGRRHSEVASEERIVPYEVVGKPSEFVQVRVGHTKYTPQELSALILRETKQMAEALLQEPVDRTVVTVPAYFNNSQRQATVDAGEIAGLKVERIINEPTAAALAYGLEKRGEGRIVVFDFGGGTFDLSILEMTPGKFRVLGVHGNTHLGGDDFDQRIMDVIADDFRRRELIDIRENPMALQRLKEAAEQAKCQLSMQVETRISLPFLSVDANGPKHLEYTLSRDRFESVCSDLFDNLRRSCRIILAETGIAASSIDEVIMVGGSTRIPMVQQVARDLFQTDALNKSINPDEVVALGAATLGGVLQGDLHDVNLMDVTAHSLGIESAGGGAERLLPKNTPIPTSVKHMFTTPKDRQTAVPINVLEGESKTAVENRPLGVFRLTGIRRAPAGVPRIEVEFTIDSDGILKVTATDQATGKSQNIVITGGCGLADHEIERMKKATAMRATKEEEIADHLDLHLDANRVIHDMRQWLEYNARLIPNKPLDQIETAIRKLEKKSAKGDRAGIRAAIKRLDEASNEYRNAG